MHFKISTSRREKYFLPIFGFLLAVCFAPTAPAQSNKPDTDQDGRWVNGIGEPLWFEPEAPRQEIERLKARWKLIELENAKPLTDPLAGNYGNGGETHGSFLRWAPLAGFVLVHVDKCAARVMGFSYGSVIATPNSIQLVPEGEFSPTRHGHSHSGVESKFLVIRWRSAPYLTIEKYVEEFLDSLAGLGKSNENSYWELPVFRKWGVEDVGSADVLPVVPPGYQRYVKRPINLSITSVGRRIVKRFNVEYDTEPQYESRTPVIVNGGRSQGVKPGMKFWVLDSDESDEVIIRSVASHASSGVIVRGVEKDPTRTYGLWKDYDRYPRIKTGWRLSTSIHKLMDENHSESETND
jgi:hypothetical protein